MKFEILQEILNGENDEYIFIEEQSYKIDPVWCKEYFYVIIQRNSDKKYFKVIHWTDTGGYGITPESEEEMLMTEVKPTVKNITEWR